MRSAPLSRDYREEPLWWQDAGFPAVPAGSVAHEADVAVIGAGYTGLCAALALRNHGRGVVVFDKQPLGRGASGRNAGMIHAGLQHDVDWLRRHRGDAGVALHQASVDAVRFVASMASSIDRDAGFQQSGWLHLAHRPSATRRLSEQNGVRTRVGETTQLLDSRALRAETNARGFHGALVTDNGASIHPARYLAGLAHAALAAGVEVHERCAVTRVGTRAREGFIVDTTNGSVTVRDLLVASNGYTDDAVPALRRRVIPIGSYIVTTEPLDDALADEVSPRRRMMSDTRNFLHYWRLTPDRRLLFGGRTSFRPVSLQHARDRLHADMVAMYPQLAGMRVTHAWTGSVGFTFDRLPHLGRAGGIAYAMGYCGSGVAMASWLGTLAGEWLAGGEPPEIATMPFRTLPGYTGHPWFLPLAGVYYQLRDQVV